MYPTKDGLTKIETTFYEDTVWLSIDQIAELFQCDRSVIVKHVRNICLLYTSDAADEEDSVDLGGRRIIKKKKRGEDKGDPEWRGNGKQDKKNNLAHEN